MLLHSPLTLPSPPWRGRGQGEGEAGLRYNEDAIAAGAQTERGGKAGPVRDCFAARPHRPVSLMAYNHLLGRRFFPSLLSGAKASPRLLRHWAASPALP